MALVHLSETNAGEPMELHRGDTVELRLPESPGSGYLWRWRLPEALCLVADEHVPDGERRLAFDVRTSGLHELRVELARPWEGESQRALTFLLHAR